MQPDYTRIWPYVFAALLVFAIYRRLRRSFGRQLFSPVRMRIRLCLLAIVGCSVLPMSMRSAGFMLAGVCGLGAGIGLGAWGAARTRYQRAAGRLYYIPHTYTGILVTLLFLGRIVYRLVILSTGMPAGETGMTSGETGLSSGADPLMMGGPAAYAGNPAMMTSPLTLGLLYVLVGYYVYYYGRLLWKVKHIAPEDVEVETTSSANST